jgi:chitin synthase
MQRKKSLIRPERGGYPAGAGASSAAVAAAAGSLKRRRQQGGYGTDTVNSNSGRPASFFQGSLKRKDKKKSKQSSQAEEEGPESNIWAVCSRILTCCFPNAVLYRMGKTDPHVQQAYREKVALCLIIFFMMLIVGFLTFGFQTTVCVPTDIVRYTELPSNNFVAIHGQAWSIQGSNPHPVVLGQSIDGLLRRAAGSDLSALFPPSSTSGPCAGIGSSGANGTTASTGGPLFTCTAKTATGQTLWPDQ